VRKDLGSRHELDRRPQSVAGRAAESAAQEAALGPATSMVGLADHADGFPTVITPAALAKRIRYRDVRRRLLSGNGFNRRS
jgi:hypothetical protein